MSTTGLICGLVGNQISLACRVAVLADFATKEYNGNFDGISSLVSPGVIVACMMRLTAEREPIDGADPRSKQT